MRAGLLEIHQRRDSLRQGVGQGARKYLLQVTRTTSESVDGSQTLDLMKLHRIFHRGSRSAISIRE